MPRTGLAAAGGGHAKNAEPEGYNVRISRLLFPQIWRRRGTGAAGASPKHLVAVPDAMSLASFQRALCDLIASPRLCLALRADPDATLAAYDLSPRERERLTTVVRQRGMSTNCTLYRSNRITPIYTLLPFTCRSLGAQFGTLIEEYWAGENYRDGQFKSEVERFSVFLRRRIAAGSIASAFTRDLLAFELARNTLEFGPR